AEVELGRGRLEELLGILGRVPGPPDTHGHYQHDQRQNSHRITVSRLTCACHRRSLVSVVRMPYYAGDEGGVTVRAAVRDRAVRRSRRGQAGCATGLRRGHEVLRPEQL